MKNFVQEGCTLRLTAPTGGVVGGNGYLIGSLFVVATATIAEGLPFEGSNEGVYDLPAASGASTALTEGLKVYWDNSGKVVTKTASGNTFIGHAVAVKADGTAIARVRLQPSS